MIFNEEKKVRLAYLGSVSGVKGTDNDLINMFRNATPNEKRTPYFGAPYRKVNFDHEEYYIFETTDGNTVYKSIPLVDDDEIFHWETYTRRNKGKYMKCQVDLGMYHFNLYIADIKENHVRISLVYRSNKEVTSSHMYECDNKALLKEMEGMLHQISSHANYCLTKLSA